MENLSILPYLSLSFSFGLLSLLTPCVFPLIPITVSYFTKRQELEKAKPILDAFLYSFGIILSFTVVGFLIALLFGASGVNRLAANPYINLIIAGIFILFAFNLFGMFEIIGAFPLSGVVWYQGESNAEIPDLEWNHCFE